MLERLLRLRVPIYGVIFDDTVMKPADHNIVDIQDCIWQVMEDVCPILEPLAELTELLEKDDLPAKCFAYVILHNLISDVLKISDGDSDGDRESVAKDLKNKIKLGLIKRFKVDEQGMSLGEVLPSPLIVASLLDPWYKKSD